VNAARVIGPALAGGLLAVTTEAVCFALNAASFVAVFVALARMRFPKHEVRGEVRGLRESWVEGFRYVTRFAPARALLALSATVSFTIMPYAPLMPVYAKDVLQGGPQELGALLSAAGAGALACTVYLARRESIVGLGRVIVAAAIASGIALAVFGQVRWMPLALLLMVVAGGGVILAAAASNTILQTIVTDDLRGRVAGFYTLAFLGVAPLGNLAAGAMAQRFGVPATFLVNGIACVAIALWFLRGLPRLKAAIRPVYVQLGLLPPEE
jgi:MFS family permease